MHDRLFEARGALEPPALRAYAAEIGLNVPCFDHEPGAHGFSDRVASDRESGLRSGVQGTPAFFVHGLAYASAWDTASLAQTIKGGPLPAAGAR